MIPASSLTSQACTGKQVLLADIKVVAVVAIQELVAEDTEVVMMESNDHSTATGDMWTMMTLQSIKLLSRTLTGKSYLTMICFEENNTFQVVNNESINTTHTFIH